MPSFEERQAEIDRLVSRNAYVHTSILNLDFEKSEIVVKRLQELGVCARTATFSLEERRRSSEMLRSCRFSALSDEDRGTKPRKFPLGKQPTVLTHGRGQGKKKRRK